MKAKSKTVISLLFLSLIAAAFLLWISRHKPDIILITVDSLRADHLSCYGYPIPTSPNIDGIASEGVIFKNAWSVSSTTSRSIPAVMTGKYLQCAIKDEPYYAIKNMLAPRFTTLAEHLRRLSYFTAAFVQNPHLGKDSGLEQGFAAYTADAGDAAELTQKALLFLRSYGRKKPVFIWLHYIDTHGPYDAPAQYVEALRGHPAYESLSFTLRQCPGTDPIEGDGCIPRYVYRKGHDTADYYVSKYDAAISYVDQNIKKIQSALPADSVIIITSDHGEFLGEKQKYFTHSGLRRPVLHIPLIIKGSKLCGRQSAHGENVSSVDIVPTILREADPLYAFFFCPRLDGKTLSAPLSVQRSIFSYYEDMDSLRKKLPDGVEGFLWQQKEKDGFYLGGEEVNDLQGDKLKLKDAFSKELNAWRRDRPLACDDRSYRVKTPEETANIKSLGYAN